ncbi:MAG: phosphoribosyltransferase family protein [Synergistes sp.]|nr:phosphoribosyltransferase family protein [Synergistes sp.]
MPCYAAAPHDGDARLFVLALKYGNVKSLGSAMGRRMGEIFPKVCADFLVPLPLHKDSKRAFNQTELIAEGISDVCGLPVGKSFLVWNGISERQTAKCGMERMALPLDSFVASPKISGKKVILVDDVFTTGGTARAAIYAMRKVGADVCAVFVWTKRMKQIENPAAWYDDEDEILL